MARKRPRNDRTPQPESAGSGDDLDCAALFDALSDLIGGIPEPIDIHGGQKPSRERRSLGEAEELVRQALMLALDDMPARLPAAAARARLRTEQTRLGRQALARSADCASAHVLFGDLAACPEEAEAHYLTGIAAGERALGDVIETYAGQLGRVPQARGYLMARRGLLQCLMNTGRHAEALEHCDRLARLDEADTIVARFIHIDLLITLGRFAEARQLCHTHRDEAYSGWPYFRALVEFGDTGDSAVARRLLAEAVEANPHVPRLMLSGEQVESTQLLVDVGGEAEAALYVRDARATWLDVPGALAWLRSTTDAGQEKPDRHRRPPRAQELAVLAGLPQDAEEEWQIDLRREGRAGWSFYAVSAADGRMLAIDVRSGRPRGDDLWGLVTDAMRLPREGDPRRPGRIVMRPGVFPKAWSRRLAQLGIEQDIRDSLAKLELVVADVAERITAAAAARAEESLPGFDPLAAAAELADLPQEPGEIWEADIRPAPAWVTGEGEPYRPWLMLVASRTRDRGLVPDISTERPTAERLLGLVLRGMRDEGLRPERVEVNDAALVSPLSAGLRSASVSVATATAGLPAIDRVAEALTSAMGAPDTLAPLVGVPGMNDERLRRLYAAAAAFYRARPWRTVPSDTAIEIHAPGPPDRIVHVVVMGQSGVQQGLAIYEDRAALAAAVSGDEQAAARGTSLAVMFGEAFEIHAADHDRIGGCGFEVAGPEAWPLVIRLNPGFTARPPLVWEVELITACLSEVVARLAGGAALER